MTRFLLAMLAALVVLAAPATAVAAENSFEGTCDPIEGAAKFDQPLTMTEADNGYHFTGTGTCSGKLNGVEVEDAPITAKVDGTFKGSCEGSESTNEGPGSLVFTRGTPDAADDVVITFTMTFTGQASEIEFKLEGTKSGEADGHASFLTTRTPPDVLIKCAGSGNSELPFDASSETSSPLVSESPSSDPGSGPGTGSGPASGPSNSGNGNGSGSGSGSSNPGNNGNGNGGSKPSGNLSVEVPAQSLDDILANGLRVICHTPGPANCVVKVRLSKKAGKRYKLTGTIANGRATIPSGSSSATLTARLTGKARKRLKKASSIVVTVEAKSGGNRARKTITLTR